MADTKKSPYEGWRASMRETLKWYVGALVGLGTLLAGSLSLAVLPDLKGDALVQAIFLGGVAVAFILWGIWSVQTALFQRPFANSDATDDLFRGKHKELLDEILTGDDIQSVAQLDRMIEMAERRAALPPPPGVPVIKLLPGETREEAEIRAAMDPSSVEVIFPDAPKFTLDQLRAFRKAVTEFGASISLRAEIDGINRQLLVFFLIILACVGGLTHLRAEAKNPDDLQAVTFLPGAEGWAGFAAALAETCGDEGEYDAKAKRETPFDGWSQITLEGPACKGVTLAVPDSVVTLQTGG